MIYTSYYGNLKKLKNSGHKIEPISVSRITPVGIHIFTIEELFPSKELLNWWKNIAIEHKGDLCCRLQNRNIFILLALAESE